MCHLSHFCPNGSRPEWSTNIKSFRILLTSFSYILACSAENSFQFELLVLPFKAKLPSPTNGKLKKHPLGCFFKLLISFHEKNHIRKFRFIGEGFGQFFPKMLRMSGKPMFPSYGKLMKDCFILENTSYQLSGIRNIVDNITSECSVGRFGRWRWWIHSEN